MVKIILGCLLLVMGLWGCDDNAPRFSSVCRSAQAEDFPECPQEAFSEARVCDAYGLQIEGFSPEVRLSVAIADCEFPDCFTMNCKFTERDFDTGEIIAIHNGVFDLETFPMGMVSADGGDPVEYSAFVMTP